MRNESTNRGSTNSFAFKSMIDSLPQLAVILRNDVCNKNIEQFKFLIVTSEFAKILPESTYQTGDQNAVAIISFFLLLTQTYQSADALKFYHLFGNFWIWTQSENEKNFYGPFGEKNAVIRWILIFTQKYFLYEIVRLSEIIVLISFQKLSLDRCRKMFTNMCIVYAKYYVFRLQGIEPKILKVAIRIGKNVYEWVLIKAPADVQECIGRKLYSNSKKI